MTTVGTIAQTNPYANWLYNHLPAAYLRNNTDFLKQSEIDEESWKRKVFFVMRQCSNIPAVIYDPVESGVSLAVGLGVGIPLGVLQELKWESEYSVGRNFQHWFECGSVLKSKIAKLEKAVEAGDVAARILLGVLCQNGIYTGGTAGLSYGSLAGRWIVQKVRQVRATRETRGEYVADHSPKEMVHTV